MEYGCIAERLGHSFSKEIHGQLFDYSYELKEIPRGELDRFMRERDFKAINVTIPYKEEVIPYLDGMSDIAKEIGAVNTIVNKNGKLTGYNTDLPGLCALIGREGIEIKGKNVLVLGSGGTSKTAYIAAKRLGCAEVLKVSRSGKDGCITYEEAVKQHTDTQIIINTTPSGMFPKIGECAVDISAFPELEGVVDAVYNPLRSKLVCDGLKRGIKAVGGLYMLVAQAVFAAEKFRYVSISSEEIDRIYRNMVTKKQNIVLVGMPGSGKTTVGKVLAEKIGADFVDTDEEIVAREGRSIPEIFLSDGEKVFRDIESSVIRDVSSRQHTVIATGGGAVLREENIDLLKENGRIYFLDRPPQHLQATSDRPLSSNRDDLMRRYEERYHIYCGCCDVKITSPKSPEQSAKMIEEDFFL